MSLGPVFDCCGLTQDQSYTGQRPFTDHKRLTIDPIPTTDHLQPVTYHPRTITDPYTREINVGLLGAPVD